jgi:putative membrane protein
MTAEALIAYLHFLSILAVASLLLGELLLYRPGLTLSQARLLGKVDLAYGGAALAALATGLLRVFAKGASFYLDNPLFHAKWTLFVLIALVSLVPTVHYMRWRPALSEGRAPVISPGAFRLVRRLLLVEVHLLALMPLLGVLMSRGIGR